MRPKTILIGAPLGGGAILLLWAAMGARGEPEAVLGRPAPKPAAVRRPAPVDAPARVESSAPADAVFPSPPRSSPHARKA